LFCSQATTLLPLIFLKINQLTHFANLAGFSGSLGVRGPSNNERPLLVKGCLGPHMLHPVPPIGTEEIVTQAVGFRIDLGLKALL